MSTSTGAFGLAAHARRGSYRKVSSFNFFGSATAASLVLGCAWTLHANIFAASVYPTLGGSNFDEPVIRRSVVVARAAPTSSADIASALPEPPPVISAPKTVPSAPSLSFVDRFAASAPHGVEPAPQPEAPKLAEAPKPRVEPQKLAEAKTKQASPSPAPVKLAAIAPAAPAPSAEVNTAKSPGAAIRDMAQRAKAAVMSIGGAAKPTIFEKLWGKPQSKSLLAYASADASVTGSVGPGQNSATLGALPRYERDTAVYDISAHMVYLPDGTRLEAHSGLGSQLDDPRSAHIRMHGVTPPHLYELKPREALFHGVPALRLTPVGGEEAIFGRSGLLAHSFMLGPNGDSNGCVSFRDYNAFLNAYRNQGIRRLAVVTRVE